MPSVLRSCVLAKIEFCSAKREARPARKIWRPGEPILLGGIHRCGRDLDTDWLKTTMNLTLDERTKIFDKVCRLVETKHFNPGMNGVDWNALARERRDPILACTDPEVFEKEVHRLVAELKTSHTGFRHAGMRNIPAPRTPPPTFWKGWRRQRACSRPAATAPGCWALWPG